MRVKIVSSLSYQKNAGTLSMEDNEGIDEWIDSIFQSNGQTYNKFEHSLAFLAVGWQVGFEVVRCKRKSQRYTARCSTRATALCLKAASGSIMTATKRQNALNSSCHPFTRTFHRPLLLTCNRLEPFVNYSGEWQLLLCRAMFSLLRKYSTFLR